MAPTAFEQPGIGIDVGRNDHHLIDALHIHVAQAGLGLVRTLVIDVVGLLPGERSLGIQIANVERALNIVLETGARERQHVNHSGRSTDTLRADSRAGLAIDDKLIRFGIVPDSIFQGFVLIFGQTVFRALPEPRRLRHVSIAIEGRKIFGHRREFLNRHTAPLSPHFATSQFITK